MASGALHDYVCIPGRNATTAQHHQKIQALEHYMRYRRVPMALQRRVRAFFKHAEATSSDEVDLLGHLPATLQRQISIALNRKLLARSKTSEAPIYPWQAAAVCV